MSLQRIIELQLNANGVARGLQDIQNQLKGIDTAISGVNSNSLNLGAGTSSGGAQNAPIQRARRSLIDYEGQLSNVQRTITQTIGVQSRSEAAMLKYDTVTRKLNKSLAEGRLNQSEYNDALAQANRAYSTASQRATEYDNQLNRMVDSSGKTRGAFDAMRGGAANFSYQLQDVIVQMQMGTAFGTIIAQQGPQIASIFGAGGAALGVVIALAGALGGPLLSSLIGVNDSLKKLEKISEDVDKAFSQAENGASTFSDELIRTYRVSQDLARLDLSIELLRLDQALSLVAGSTDAVFDGFNSWLGVIGGFDTKQAVGSLEALESAGIGIQDIFTSQGGRNFIPVQLQGIAEYGSEAQTALAAFRSEAKNIQTEIGGIDLRSASELVQIIGDIRSGGESESDFDSQFASLNNYINGLVESGQVTDDNREKLVSVGQQLAKLINQGKQAFLSKDAISPELLERFSEIQHSVSETSQYIAELALGTDEYSSVISGIASQEQDINDILTDRLKSLKVEGDEKQKVAAYDEARAQAERAIYDGRTNAIAEYLTDLGEEANFLDEINALRARGLTITEAQAQAASQMADDILIGDLLSDTDASKLSALNAQIDLLVRNSEAYANDASFKEALQAVQDELIESTQGAYALEDASSAVNEAMRFQGVDAAIAVLDDMRAMALLTTEQYEDMRREIAQGHTDMAQSARDFATELDQEIAAINAGAQALRDYNDEMAARRALGISTVRELSKSETEAVDLYIQKTKERKRAEAGTMESFLGSMDDAAGSFAQLADAVGKGSEEMQVVLAAVAAAQAVNAVLNQAAGDPYTAFARMAAMAATVAQLGVALGGLSGGGNISADRQSSQGTGTVLGDVAAKSESIVNATEYAADALKDLVGINSGMLTELRNLNNAMSGASNLIARDVNFSGIAGGLGLSSEASIIGSLSADAGALFDSMFFGLTNDLFENLLGGVGGFIGGGLFGSSSVKDEGIRILGGTLEDILNDTTAQAFQTVQKKSWFSSSTRDSFRDVSSAVENQFDLVFQSLFGTVESAVTGLGFDSTSVQERLNSFVVETMRISLRDLSPEEQLDEINDVFSKTFDELASFVAPALLQFQQAGEGMGETLSRVSTNFQVVNEAINQLNLSALTGGVESVLDVTESFVGLFGGAGELASAFTGFVDTFATDERQLEILTEGLTRALGEQDVAILKSRDGVYDYIRAVQESGVNEVERIANILSLTDSLDDYFNLLESVNNSQTESIANYTELQIRLANAMGDSDLSLRLSREQELADAVDDTARSYLNSIYAAEDLAIKSDEIASAQQRLNSSLGLDELNTQIQRQEELASASSDAARALLAQVYAAEDAEVALDNAASALSRMASAQISMTDNAFSVLQKSIDAQKESLTDAYDTQVESLNKATENFSDVISALQSLSSSLAGAITASQVDTLSLNYSRLASARRLISSTLSAGSVPTDGSLDNAIGQLSGDNTRFYSTFEDYAVDQAKQQNDLKELKRLTDSQLGTTKTASDLAESQLEVLRDTYDSNIEALDKQLDYWSEQIEISRGTFIAATDIALAISNLQGALSVEEQGASQYSSNEIQSYGKNLFDTMIDSGSTEDEAFKAIGIAAIENGVSSSELARAFGVSQAEVLDIASRVGVPAFATGGTHSGGMRLVGEQGAEMELTGPSRIFSANQTSNIMGGAMVGSAEVLSELKYTNQLLRDLNVKMIESNDNTDLLETFAVNGLPVNATIVADLTV